MPSHPRKRSREEPEESKSEETNVVASSSKKRQMRYHHPSSTEPNAPKRNPDGSLIPSNILNKCPAKLPIKPKVPPVSNKVAVPNSTAHKDTRNHLPAGIVVCSAHNKKRTVQNMEVDGKGGWQCTAEKPCANATGYTAMLPKSMCICRLHGKRRTKANMIQNQYGQFQCAEYNACRGGGSPPNRGRGRGRSRGRGNPAFGYGHPQMQYPQQHQNMQQQWAAQMAMNPMMAQMFRMMGYDPSAMMQPVPGLMEEDDSSLPPKCALHGKYRTMQNLEKDDDGKWVCRLDSECQIGSGKYRQ